MPHTSPGYSSATVLVLVTNYANIMIVMNVEIGRLLQASKQ